MTRILPLAIAAAAVLGAALWWFVLRDPAPQVTQIQPLGSAEASEADVNTDGIVEMVQGAADAPVEVIEYASFTCPHCGTFHQTVYPQLKADYIDTGKVRFVYREVYFDKYGMWASLIARCAGPEKFFGITDLIYKTQRDWTRAGSDAAIAEELRKIGRLAGIDNAQLDACLSDADTLRSLVAWYQANAQKDGISSTPSFVIDGQLYSNMAYSEFQGILNEKLGQ
ncbi:DsbA family protein [Thalassococcus sp. CAU 1522]|uniref:DsbA family protein n=1 Tax=Thalassococcus arenae TaxID=2851652 RepID=A0ABS6N8Y0_9RHOB|nr:DsbA family protein [Thalassococcus arenae]MBV2360152.1 DsbA family protein [Thalassococcus arenae]